MAIMATYKAFTWAFRAKVFPQFETMEACLAWNFMLFWEVPGRRWGGMAMGPDSGGGASLIVIRHA